MRKTNDKKEYCRAQAVLEKSEGKTHKEIAKEHGEDGLLRMPKKGLKDYRYLGVVDRNPA